MAGALSVTAGVTVGAVVVAQPVCPGGLQATHSTWPTLAAVAVVATEGVVLFSDCPVATGKKAGPQP